MVVSGTYANIPKTCLQRIQYQSEKCPEMPTGEGVWESHSVQITDSVDYIRSMTTEWIWMLATTPGKRFRTV